MLCRFRSDSHPGVVARQCRGKVPLVSVVDHNARARKRYESYAHRRERVQAETFQASTFRWMHPREPAAVTTMMMMMIMMMMLDLEDDI